METAKEPRLTKREIEIAKAMETLGHMEVVNTKMIEDFGCRMIDPTEVANDLGIPRGSTLAFTIANYIAWKQLNKNGNN